MRHKKTFLPVSQEDISSCVTIRHVLFCSGHHQREELVAQSLRRRVHTDTANQESTAQAEAEEHEWGSETEVTRAETPSIFDGQAGQRKTQKREASHVR